MRIWNLVIAACVASAGLFAACDTQPSTEAKPDDAAMAAAATDSTNEAVTRAFIERVLNNGDTVALMEYSDPAFVEHNLMPGMKPGVEGMKEWLIGWREAFPDGKFTVKDIIIEGEKVVVHTVFNGTNSGPFMGQPPTNKPVSMEAIDIVHIRNGKQTDHWGQADVMAMMSQLGMMPASMTMGAPPSEAKK